jgi:hypothetical protein
MTMTLPSRTCSGRPVYSQDVGLRALADPLVIVGHLPIRSRLPVQDRGNSATAAGEALRHRRRAQWRRCRDLRLYDRAAAAFHVIIMQWHIVND